MNDVVKLDTQPDNGGRHEEESKKEGDDMVSKFGAIKETCYAVNKSKLI